MKAKNICTLCGRLHSPKAKCGTGKTPSRTDRAEFADAVRQKLVIQYEPARLLGVRSKMDAADQHLENLLEVIDEIWTQTANNTDDPCFHEVTRAMSDLQKAANIAQDVVSTWEERCNDALAAIR